MVGKEDIATSRIELSPSLQHRKLVQLLREQGIHVTWQMTLMYGKVLNHPVLGEIAKRHHATPTHVALAWASKLGYSVIPPSTKRENLAGNLRSQQRGLPLEDMAQIAALERTGRAVSPEGLAPVRD